MSRIFLPEPGAAPVRLGSLVRSLAMRGAHVEVLTTTPPPGFAASDYARDPGVIVKRAPALRDRAGYIRGYLQYMSFDVPLGLRLLFARRPDVVVVEPPPTSGVVVRIACALRRVPYVYFAADIWGDAVQHMSGSRLVHRALRAMELFAWRGAARVLSTSDESSERISELAALESVVTIGNGADLTRFSVDGPVRDEGRPYFLYPGTASEVHGAGVFLDAFADLASTHPTARLVFVGSGAHWEELRRRAEEFAPGQVTVHDRVSPEEIATWLRGATAVLASLSPGKYDHAFSTRMYAAVACGTRVIFAGRGPGRRFAEQGAVGWGVEYDAAAIADAMRAALDEPSDPAARRSLAEWAEANVSLNAVTDRAAEVILRVGDGVAAL